MFTRAITRKPGKNFHRGITGVSLGTPGYTLILQQHDAYIRTLRSLGLEVILLDAHPDFPDAYFVEDTAVVTPEVAAITLPGAAARQGEEDTIEAVLAKYRKTVRIRSPGTLDGGDVFAAGNHYYIGLSERTNKNGAEQLGSILEEYDHSRTIIPVRYGLHLRAGVNYIGHNTLLLNEEYATLEAFKKYSRIVLDKDEAYAANTLWTNDRLITPKGFPKTRKKLSTMGIEIIELDVSEMHKMDGGLTCMSIRF